MTKKLADYFHKLQFVKFKANKVWISKKTVFSDRGGIDGGRANESHTNR